MKQIKIVPDEQPNDTGKWVPVPDDVSFNGRWDVVANQLARYIPTGWHLVAIDSSGIGVNNREQYDVPF